MSILNAGCMGSCALGDHGGSGGWLVVGWLVGLDMWLLDWSWRALFPPSPPFPSNNTRTQTHTRTHARSHVLITHSCFHTIPLRLISRGRVFCVCVMCVTATCETKLIECQSQEGKVKIENYQNTECNDSCEKNRPPCCEEAGVCVDCCLMAV